MRKARRITVWSGAAMCGLLPLALMFRSVGRPVMVIGHSMEPSLHSGQWVWMRMRRGTDPAPRVGEVVVFRLGGATYIKRVAAGPGDVVETAHFWNDSLEVMDSARKRALVERFAAARPELVRISYTRMPLGKMFVLGDASCESMDSRDFGPVAVSSVMGKVLEPTLRITWLRGRGWSFGRRAVAPSVPVGMRVSMQSIPTPPEPTLKPRRSARVDLSALHVVKYN